MRWTPAAFVGGLAYGFSAAVIVQLAFGWLNLACLALLPLIVACVDELFIRQRRRPARVGVALAVLMTVEFFISTEMVLIVAVSAVIGHRPAGGIRLAARQGRAPSPRPLRAHRHGHRGGPDRRPARLPGMVLPGRPGPPERDGVVDQRAGQPRELPQQLLEPPRSVGPDQFPATCPGGTDPRAATWGRPSPSPSYLGPGLLLVLVAGDPGVAIGSPAVVLRRPSG